MIDGVPCIGYQADYPSSALVPPKTRGATPETLKFNQVVKIWIANSDGFPRRIEYGAPIAVSVTLKDFNAQIEITPP
jgi:hypothetical protein